MVFVHGFPLEGKEVFYKTSINSYIPHSYLKVSKWEKRREGEKRREEKEEKEEEQFGSEIKSLLH